MEISLSILEKQVLLYTLLIHVYSSCFYLCYDGMINHDVISAIKVAFKISLSERVIICYDFILKHGVLKKKMFSIK